MKEYLKFMSSPACLGVFFLLAGVAAFSAAMFLQYVMHLMPCELCYLERKPWIVLSFLGLLILFFKERAFSFFALLGCLTLAVSFGLGILHIGVEAGWWSSPFPSCMSQTNLYGSLSHGNILDEMPDLPAKPCDLPDYVLGLPLTLWAFFYTLLSLFGTFVLIFGKSHLASES